MTSNGVATSRPGRNDGLAIATAALVTTLDGFDAFSFNLVAPHIRADLGLSTASLGPLFASTLAGMIIGATLGGMLADRFGRLRVLIVVMTLFGGAAFALPFAASGTDVIINRLVGGIGLGAAAPIAIGLLNRAVSKPPSELVIGAVMSGIPLGGCLAALFNYLVVPTEGWRSIFYLGGLLPLPVIVLAYIVFRGVDRLAMERIERPGLAAIFGRGRTFHAVVIAGMFFFGYVITALITNWLPTILAHRGASPLMISVTFGALTVSGIIGILLLGLVATKTQLPGLVPIVWLVASLTAMTAVIGGLGTQAVALLALAACTTATGAQVLSIAMTNTLYRERGLETSAIGIMTALGRVGQASALGVSGLIMTFAGSETAVFAFAGVCGIVAALFGVLVIRFRAGSSHSPDGARSAAA